MLGWMDEEWNCKSASERHGIFCAAKKANEELCKSFKNM